MRNRFIDMEDNGSTDSSLLLSHREFRIQQQLSADDRRQRTRREIAIALVAAEDACQKTRQ